MYKCQVCDGKNERSVDELSHKYLRNNGKYYHFDCYISYLVCKKHMDKEDALVEAERLHLITVEEIKKTTIRDDFFKLIQNKYYKELPKSFFTRVDSITKGEYKKKDGFEQSISYFELYEMYSNDKMMLKLDKIAYSNNIKQDERIFWDLAVMFNEYSNYIKAKRRAIKDSDEAKDAINNIRKYKIDAKERYKEQRDKTIDSNKVSIDIDSIVDELLL